MTTAAANTQAVGSVASAGSAAIEGVRVGGVRMAKPHVSLVMAGARYAVAVAS